MIGSILNQIRHARALELRELTADALVEAQLQSYAIEAIAKEHRRANPASTPNRIRTGDLLRERCA